VVAAAAVDRVAAVGAVGGGGGVFIPVGSDVAAADEVVVAVPAEDQVVALPAEDGVVAGTAVDGVVTGAVVQAGVDRREVRGGRPGVIDLAEVAEGQVVAAPGADVVAAGACDDRVVAAPGGDRVVAAQGRVVRGDEQQDRDGRAGGRVVVVQLAV